MSNLTEEQQIEQLKDWWKDNGTALIVGAVLGLSGFFGYKYWTEKEIAYQESASDLYVQVSEQIEAKDSIKLAEAAKAVKTQYPDSSYAILSAMHLAKIAVDENKLDNAATELTWAIDNNGSSELVDIVKIRLARVLIAQQKADQALPFLAFETDSGYFEFASLVKGDALMALGKKAEALEAYRAADNAGKTTASHPTLKLKIDELATIEKPVNVLDTVEQNDSESDSSIEAESNKTDESEAEQETKTEEASE